MSQQEFLASIKSGALENWRKHLILPSIVGAQAALESAWGESELATKANNLFGIKGDYKGSSHTVKTNEYINGQWIRVDAAFKKYPDKATSVADHGAFFTSTDWRKDNYKAVIGETDYKKAAKALVNAPAAYASDPSYAEKVINIIEQYELYKWDEEAGIKKGEKQSWQKKTDQQQDWKQTEKETMKMSRSPYIDHVVLTNKHSGRRTHKVQAFVIHHMAARWTGKRCAEYFRDTPSRQASTNYAIGYDGDVALNVEERNRAWTSSSNWADQRAITFELANSKMGHPWTVSDTTINKAIVMLAELHKRYGLKKASYTGNTNGTLWRHDWFAGTNCPGPYLGGKLSYMADEINKILRGENSSAAKSVATPSGDQYVNGAKKEKDEVWGFTVTTPLGIKVRDLPSTTATHTHSLKEGDNITYDKVYSGNGHMWLSYIDKKDKKRYYVPYREIKKPNDVWGEFVEPEKEDSSKANDTISSANYVVKSGDTLNKIGEEFGVSAASIAVDNGITDPDLIVVGQELVIKEKAPIDPIRLRNWRWARVYKEPSFDSEAINSKAANSSLTVFGYRAGQKDNEGNAAWILTDKGKENEGWIHINNFLPDLSEVDEI